MKGGGRWGWRGWRWGRAVCVCVGGGITLQAEPSSLRCAVETEDQREPPPLLACLRRAARGPRCQEEEITGFCIWMGGVGGWDEVRIKNKTNS